MLSKDLISHLEQELTKTLGETISVLDHHVVSGGSINDTYRLATNSRSFFLKLNRVSTYPGMFAAEAKGLELLASHTSLRVPEVIHEGALDDEAFLIMEFLEQGQQAPDFWEAFGSNLATLHRNTNDHFGLDHDNYIGSIPQINKAHSNWAEFFIEERLEFQLKRARDANKVSGDVLLRMERLFHRLHGLFPEEPPSLLHGDLWSGNFSCAENGYASIFDPAVYYGHREMDIGMSKLFGGFDEKFYYAYNEEWPLEDGWHYRVDLANLYPLLVHVNLFGGGYLSQVRLILARFT